MKKEYNSSKKSGERGSFKGKRSGDSTRKDRGFSRRRDERGSFKGKRSGDSTRKDRGFSRRRDERTSLKDKNNIEITLSPEVIDYFKLLSKDMSVPYQQLINFYLLDCVKKQKKLSIEWTGS